MGSYSKKLIEIKKLWDEDEKSRVHPKDEKSRVYPEDELFDLCIEVCSTHDPDLILRMKVLETEVHRMERLQTHLWRLRSNSTWVKIGDAPTAYFFMLVKAKCIRETVKALARANGSITEDEQELLSGVHTHYASLYKKGHKVATFHRTLA